MRNSRLRRITEALPALIPPLLLLYGIGAYGVNVPVQDDWNDAIVFIHETARNGLSWSSLLVPHNEHRIFFPKLATLLFWKLTRLGGRPPLYLDWLLLCGAALLLLEAFIGNRVILGFKAKPPSI